MPRPTRNAARLAAAAAAGGAATRSLATRLMEGEALLVSYEHLLSPATRATLMLPGVDKRIFDAISEYPVFQAVVKGKRALGDGLRRNGPLEALRSEPALLAAAEDVLRAAREAIAAAGISRALAPRAERPLLASGPFAGPQPAHADAGTLAEADLRVDAAQSARAAKGGNAAGQLDVPLTALIALARPASLLLSGYTLAEDRALGDDSPVFPGVKKPMVRRAVPAFCALVFGQHVVHAGDANGAEHHARMHIFLEHADVLVVPDSTSIVGALGEVVASYYAAPPLA